MAAFDSLFADLKAANDSWTELYALLKGAQYDTGTPRQAIDSLPVDHLNRRALFIFELLNGIRPDTDADVTATLLGTRENEIRGGLRTIRKNAQAATNQIKPHVQEAVTIRDSNNNLSLTMVRDTKQLAAYDAAGNFTSIHQAVNQLIPIVSTLVALSKTPGAGDLFERVQVLANILSSANQILGEIRNITEQTKKNASEASSGSTGLDR